KSPASPLTVSLVNTTDATNHNTSSSTQTKTKTKINTSRTPSIIPIASSIITIIIDPSDTTNHIPYSATKTYTTCSTTTKINTSTNSFQKHNTKTIHYHSNKKNPSIFQHHNRPLPAPLPTTQSTTFYTGITS